MIVVASNPVVIEAAGLSADEVYWRFISGFSLIASSLGHAKQNCEIYANRAEPHKP